MSVTNVKAYLSAFGLEGRVREFETSSATVEMAAAALGTEPAHIAKTMSLKLGEGCVLVVAAGDVKVDNGKFKAVFHTKASFLRAEEVAPLTGYPVGGVCPFGNPANTPVYCDVSLRRFATVFPAAGTASSAVRLSCDELFAASRAIAWVDVCKLREE